MVSLWAILIVTIISLIAAGELKAVEPVKPLKFYVYDDPEWSKMGTFTMRPRDKTGRKWHGGDQFPLATITV